MKFNKALAICLVILLSFIIIFITIRQLSDREIDDLHPDIPCSEEYLQKSDMVFVIPLFNNNSIANDNEWCNKILALNKTIGMHGVYHGYNEFLAFRDKDYLDNGIIEFEKCFGFKPEIFKAPQWRLAEENK